MVVIMASTVTTELRGIPITTTTTITRSNKISVSTFYFTYIPG